MLLVKFAPSCWPNICCKEWPSHACKEAVIMLLSTYIFLVKIPLSYLWNTCYVWSLDCDFNNLLLLVSNSMLNSFDVEEKCTKFLTVTCPLGVSGSSHWITIVLELSGRTCTFRGADPGSGTNKTILRTLEVLPQWHPCTGSEYMLSQ